MIRFERTVIAESGKLREAIKFAIGIKDHINASMGLANTVHVMTPKFGGFEGIIWSVDLENLAALDDLQEKIASDGNITERREDAIDLFVEGSMHDRVYNLS